MQSLTDLNNYSESTVAFEDNRPFTIILTNTGNAAVTLNESEYHQMPVMGEITYLISAPPTITYTIDLSNAGGKAAVIWDPLPAGITASQPQPNVYRLTGIVNVAQWNQIRQPSISLLPDYATNYTYTASINAGSPYISTWTVAVTINDASEVNTLTLPAVTYDEDTPRAVGAANIFQITDVENAFGMYNVVGTMSIPTAGRFTSNVVLQSESMTGGVLSITDNKTNVNNYLKFMQFTPTPDFDQDFTVSWAMTSQNSGLTTSLQPQNYLIGIKNEEITNMNLPRSYLKNGVDLLFPNNVPFISETIAGATYTCNFTLAADVGIINPGSDLINMPGWNQSTRTYTYTGTKDQLNNLFTGLRFLGKENVFTSTTVQFTMSRDGVSTVNQTFSLTGSDRSNIIAGANVTLHEDEMTYFWSQPSFNLHYSKKFCIVVEPMISSVPVSTVAWFNNTGWTVLGTAQNQTGIMKNVAKQTNVNSFIAELESIKNVQLSLRPDFAGFFTMRFRLGIDSIYSGTSINGGTVVTHTKSFTLEDTAEFSLPDANYSEDLPLNVAFAITDEDQNYSSYTVTITQMSPDPVTTPCRFMVNGILQPAGVAVTLNASKSSVNTNVVKFIPPPDYVNTIQLKYRQTKLDNGVTVVQANDVLKSYPCTVQNSEFVTPPTTVNTIIYEPYILNQFYITDEDPASSGVPSAERTYTLLIVDTQAKGKFYAGGNPLSGHGFQITGNKNYVNGYLTGTTWLSKIDHFTNFTYNLVRNNDNVTLANGSILVYSNMPNYGSLWQGGYFGGRVSTTGTTDDYYIVSSPYLVYYGPDPGWLPPGGEWDYILTEPRPTGPGWENSSVVVFAKPPVNSYYDGYANTTFLKNYLPPKFEGFISTNICWYASLETTNGYTDWYVPSANELRVCKQNAGIPISTNYPFPVNNTAIFWTSTLTKPSTTLLINYAIGQSTSISTTPYVTHQKTGQIGVDYLTYSGVHTPSGKVGFYNTFRRVPITAIA